MPDLAKLRQDLHTGIGIIDSQHQTFLTLLEKLRSGNISTDHDKLSCLIEELHLYTLYHFEFEEKLMTEHSLSNLEAHKQEHQDMVDKIEDFRIQNLLNESMLASEMGEFLENWLIKHIKERDMIDLAPLQQTS